jgi:hypothetical protein
MKQITVWKERQARDKTIQKLLSAEFERPPSMVFINLKGKRDRSMV